VGHYGDDQAFWAGSETSSSAPFHVGHNGNLTCKNFSMPESADIIVYGNGPHGNDDYHGIDGKYEYKAGTTLATRYMYFLNGICIGCGLAS
jgi:hypothetical protein